MVISLLMHHRFSLSEVQHFLHVSGSYVPLKKVLYFHCFGGSAAARDANCVCLLPARRIVGISLCQEHRALCLQL